MADDECPLCVEPFEAADKLFLPCDCGFQVRLGGVPLKEFEVGE